MSQCPFGTQVEKGIAPVLKKIGNNMDFQLNFIGNVDPNQSTGFSSMHGESEVLGNIWQLCAAKHYPENYKYMDFILCQNQNMRAIPTNSESCAGKTGLDAAKLKACVEGAEGKALMGISVGRAKNRRATGSPTIFINNQRYSGGRTEGDFLRAICNGMKGSKPEACSNIPEPVKINTLVLTDSRCKQCNNSRLGKQLKGLFPGMVSTEHDYSKPAGKAKYAELTGKHGKVLLPAFFFDKTVEKGAGYARVKRYLKPYGAYMHLNIGAKWDPTSEICDNGSDDTGNGKVDCADPSCQSTLACRKEIPKKLDVFVMSQCPFGVKALNAMEEVLANFGDDVDFDIHFIADEDPNTPSGFKALHGEPEVMENIRELCAIKHYPKGRKYMQYILCRNKNYKSNDWRPCATNGIDPAVIEKCSSGAEGKEFHRADIKMDKSLGFSASPTWLANNRYKFSGVDAETVKRNFCQRNPGTKNCDKKLSGKPAGSGGGAACGGK